MTVQYAQPQDVYDLGLTAPAFVARPRALDGRQGDYLDFATGTFALIGHGLTSLDLVRVVLIASGGGAPGGANVRTVYHPLPIDYWRFQLSLTQSGAPVTFADAGTAPVGGTSAWGIQVDPARRLSRVLFNVSADIDQDLTAHSTPILVNPATGTYPDKLVGIVARVGARRAITGLQFENPAFKAAAERVFAEEKRDDEQRAAWRLGQPIYPTPVDQDGVADASARANNRYSSGTYTSGWTQPAPHSSWSRGTL